MPVFPEALCFLLVLGNSDIDIFLLFNDSDNIVYASVQQIGIVTVNLDNND